MTFSQYLLTLILSISTFTFITADIVPGKCPKVSGTKFNCLEITRTFQESNHPNYDFKLQPLIYGFLPSSPDSKSLNAFAFNLQNSDISNFYASLICRDLYNNNLFNLRCGAMLNNGWDVR